MRMLSSLIKYYILSTWSCSTCTSMNIIMFMSGVCTDVNTCCRGMQLIRLVREPTSVHILRVSVAAFNMGWQYPTC